MPMCLFYYHLDCRAYCMSMPQLLVIRIRTFVSIILLKTATYFKYTLDISLQTVSQQNFGGLQLIHPSDSYTCAAVSIYVLLMVSC